MPDFVLGPDFVFAQLCLLRAIVCSAIFQPIKWSSGRGFKKWLRKVALPSSGLLFSSVNPDKQAPAIVVWLLCSEMSGKLTRFLVGFEIRSWDA